MAIGSVLQRVSACDPSPAEIIVHVDRSDGELEKALNGEFPHVRILSSSTQLGPGGGRHRCLLSCKAPYAVSLDDDSYPIDADFFATVDRLFQLHQDTAIIGARVWARGERIEAKRESFHAVPNYAGGGHAVRLSAYREIRGYLPRALAYGMEEADVSIQ